VHGLAVTLLLCSDAEASGRTKSPGDLIAVDLAGTDRLEVPIDGRRLSLPAMPSPTPDVPRYGPLLRKRLRAADRPGILQNLPGG
jgi:hypothetical protein